VVVHGSGQTKTQVLRQQGNNPKWGEVDVYLTHTLGSKAVGGGIGCRKRKLTLLTKAKVYTLTAKTEGADWAAASLGGGRIETQHGVRGKRKRRDSQSSGTKPRMHQ